MVNILSYRKIFQNKLVSQIFIFILSMFLITSFAGEWRVYSNQKLDRLANSENYQAIVNNTILLNRCYVDSPDENYCFSVLKIISSQLNNADYKTDNIKSIWTNCYLYLASIALDKYPKLHDRWVTISLNEELIGGVKSDYIPSTPINIKKYREALKAEYNSRIKLELIVREDKLRASKENYGNIETPNRIK